jgi:hypothetical protein
VVFAPAVGPAAVVQDSLKRAGFRITLDPIAASSDFDTIGNRDNTSDMMRSSWVPDFTAARPTSSPARCSPDSTS